MKEIFMNSSKNSLLAFYLLNCVGSYAQNKAAAFSLPAYRAQVRHPLTRQIPICGT